MKISRVPLEDMLPWEPGYGFLSDDTLKLAATLESVRRTICAYRAVGDMPCDCKYGRGLPILEETERAMGHGWSMTTDAPAHGWGEQTGCPELRSVIFMLLHPQAGDFGKLF